MCPGASRALTLAPAMRMACLFAVALTLTACGGSNSNSNSTATITVTNYTVGGTIIGLTAGSVVLANNDSTTVTVAAGASSWTFPASFAPGSSYSVTVQTQPSDELCAVTSDGSGTNTGDVGDVVVTCGFGEWNWKGGSNTINATGVYGTQGSAVAGDVPGARYAASSWTDSSGNFWLFGGDGYDSTGTAGYLNDLWQYSPSSGLWTWISGASAANAAATYGNEGTAASGNVPGARYAASSWIDSSGNLWLFGGVGNDSAGNMGSLNDLWKYSPNSKEWTWVSGAEVDNSAGVYGSTQGTATSSTVPGARYAASSWIDSTGNLWLFGGYGYDSSGAVGNLNDLWQYSPTTGLWTWISGGSAHNALGVYGTQGSASTGNVPGARYAASSWIDSSGDLWLFGGSGYDSSGSVGKLDDLWEFSRSSAQWTWIGGDDTVNSPGVYPTRGTASSAALPGAREAANSWIDSSGNLWLFGGVGYGSTGAVGNLNDLWKYTPSSKEWTLLSGGNGENVSGVYGTQGTASPADLLGGRNFTSSWIDSAGNFWVFGGVGYDSSGDLGYLNDLWQYNPNAGG